MRHFVADRLAGTRLERPVRQTYRRLTGRQETPQERRNRVYDELTSAAIRRVLSKGSNAIDAGAHKGYFLRQMLHVAPGGEHHAFEPIPRLAAELERAYPRAHVHACALGAEDGEATFRVVTDEPTQSSLHLRADREQGRPVEELTVPVRRLDSVWPAELPLAFVKIDVEDAEVDLIRGGTETLRRWRPVVVFECHARSLPAAAEALDDAGLTVRLIQDLFSDRVPDRAEVLSRAVETGEWYFGARA